MNTNFYADDTYVMMTDSNLTALQNRVNLKLENIGFCSKKTNYL